MDDDYNDDYPLLDFMLSDDLGASAIYAEDQVTWGPDGPELSPIEPLWDYADDGYDDAYDEQSWLEGSRSKDEEFYPIDPRELSSCYEEWEDYC